MKFRLHVRMDAIEDYSNVARRMAALRGLYAMGQEAEARGEVMPDWEARS